MNELFANETGTAYAAFLTYLELGLDRNFDGTARKPGKGKGTIKRWEERARAYDDHMVKAEQEAKEAGRVAGVGVGIGARGTGEAQGFLGCAWNVRELWGRRCECWTWH